MNLFLLAHHVDITDYPVLAAMFAVGFWVGWDLVARFTAGKPLPTSRSDGSCEEP